MQPDDPTEAYQILQGYHTRPVDAAHGLWDLSRIAKHSPTLEPDLRRDRSPATCSRRSAQSEEGRDFLDELDKYLYDFGWRSDAVYDLADVPWREDPQIPLGNIAAYIPMDDSADPMIQFDKAVPRREELTAKVREKLAATPRSWRSSKSCSTPPSTPTRSPRTTPSTSIRWASCCSAGSCARSAPRSPATA